MTRTMTRPIIVGILPYKAQWLAVQRHRHNDPIHYCGNPFMSGSLFGYLLISPMEIASRQVGVAQDWGTAPDIALGGPCIGASYREQWSSWAANPLHN